MEQLNEYVTLSFKIGNTKDPIKPMTFKNTGKVISQSTVIDSNNDIFLFLTVDNNG